MMGTSIMLLLFAAVFIFGVAFAELEDGGQHYAVLVAGSNTYMNYRHQVRHQIIILFLNVAIQRNSNQIIIIMMIARKW